MIVVFWSWLKLSVRTLEPVPVPLGGWLTSPRFRPIEKTAPFESCRSPPTFSRLTSRPTKMPVPAPLRSMPPSTSRVLTSPPTVMEAPGVMLAKAIRSMAVVPFETRGPESWVSWKPRIAPICPLLIVIWPTFKTWPRFDSP